MKEGDLSTLTVTILIYQTKNTIGLLSSREKASDVMQVYVFRARFRERIKETARQLEQTHEKIGYMALPGPYQS
jgi:uncharacterized protein (DUF362 family)